MYDNTKALAVVEVMIETAQSLNIHSTVGTNGSCTPIKETVEKTHVFYKNIQKQLLVKYEQKSKVKSQEWSKLVSDKKSLIITIFRQCDEATRTKIALGTSYAANCDAGNLINFFHKITNCLLQKR